MESRHGNKESAGKTRSSELPLDYLAMVREVFSAHFDEGLKALGKIKPDPAFSVAGGIYPNEILLAVSLIHGGQLAATTVHASVDFDPKASAPTAQDLLAACVDAVGSVFEQLIDPKDRLKLEALAGESLSAFEGIPYEWTPVELERYRIFLKIDKSNPEIDKLTEDWLNQHDPERVKQAEEEESATEKLFVTGPKKGN
jgi:hypothetical protein